MHRDIDLVHRRNDGRHILCRILAISFFAIAVANSAWAYVGDSFLKLPGVSGAWKGAGYKHWVRVNGNYWPGGRAIGLSGAGGMRTPDLYSGPASPRHGEGTLVITFDKDNPDLPQLMARCAGKTTLAELSYAESSELARTTFEIGERPENIPPYFEYRLTDAQFSDCPIVPDAPQQAIVVSFKGIERLNYRLPDERVEAKFVPSTLQPAPSSPTTKSYVLTWFAAANDVSDDQCPVMNKGPTETDYYAYMSKEDADKEHAERASKGGVNYENGQMGLRGPHKLNVTMAPGIVPDPGNAEPQTKIARGLDLDGDDGTGKPPRGICKHTNYASPDGRTGIDNQLYRAQGCIGSFQGHKGFIMQFANNQMHDGQMSMLMQITGVKNEVNDKSVDVTLFYSLDPMSKSASGQVLSDYTFRVSDNPQYTHYFARLHGRIVNHVLITEPLKALRMNLGTYGTPVRLNLFNAGMRLELASDGRIKGVLGGYQEWHVIASRYTSSAAEQVHNFQVPGLYNALKRDADGLKDPVTGECNGISSAFDIEGIPAFIGPPAVVVDNASKQSQVAKTSAYAQPAR